MKTLQICRIAVVSLSVLVGSCAPYQQFVTVNPRADVPEGSKEFLIRGTMEDVLAQLTANNILYNTNESGAQTEDFMMSESTKARFNIYPFDQGVKVVPFYAYTQKVKQNAMIMGGAMSAAMVNTDMTRIVYTKRKVTTATHVFDYAVQICEKAGKVTYR